MNWPILKRYDSDHLARIAMPLGGIGTGTVSLGGRGDLRDWELMNRPAKGYVPRFGNTPFFAVWVRGARGGAAAKALEGPLPLEAYEGASGCPAPNHGLPRFRGCRFAVAYPLAQVELSDPAFPVRVRLCAFNPLIPADAEASGLPLAALRYEITNRGRTPLTVAVCGSLPNFIGADGAAIEKAWNGSPTVIGPKTNRNAFRQEAGWAGIVMSSEGVDRRLDTWGTLALATPADGVEVTHRTAWARLSWGDSLLDFWDDFTDDGGLDERDAGGADAPMASLCVRVRLKPGQTRAVPFLLTWHFPNRAGWWPTDVSKPCAEGCACGGSPHGIGKWYAERFADAWEVVQKCGPRLPALERDTVAFVRAFCGADLPDAVKEAALFNVSTLRSQTCFRTADGRLFGWEGCCDTQGCCQGSCTHVWNYEQTTAFLFGDLAMTMRDTEFAHATREDGLMAFRVGLPLSSATESGKAAADGQMGCIMKMYRDWQLSGDTAGLRRLWPRVRKALEFCWIPGGWDADRDGVMEGCQHNTMDVEYYGPNPQMGTWYLGALRAAEEMAGAVGDAEFAETCRGLYERGRAWMDKHLFNGDYYEHEVRPPGRDGVIADGLRVGMGTDNLEDPVLQLGAGCLVDQLVGQFVAHVCGLGYLLDEAHVRTTLASILKHNRRQGFHDHFNHMRSFVLGDETALLMASYPRGRRPRRPFPYYTEVMTGFEYAAAVHMLYEGMEKEGLRCIADIRARYDGRRRNPFDEAECGHHYARAMASWAAVLALTGFRYSAVAGRMEFAARPGQWFWSTGYAWGTCRLRRRGGAFDVALRVLGGEVALGRFVLAGHGERVWPAARRLGAGETVRFAVGRLAGQGRG
ncbi:MAG: hypothetical protein BWZ02_02269 [Lentisphaerae bacterium ADurb.BinA184]|nr:MAG: hypothetical protein BWZ02_02269 [Lentisphaerae bacterium ADurb.BinA184]